MPPIRLRVRQPRDGGDRALEGDRRRSRRRVRRGRRQVVLHGDPGGRRRAARALRQVRPDRAPVGRARLRLLPGAALGRLREAQAPGRRHAARAPASGTDVDAVMRRSLTMTHPSQATPELLRTHGPRYNNSRYNQPRYNNSRYNKRQFLKLLGAGAGAAAATRLGAPPAHAQATGPVKIGVLTIRAGVAAPVGAAGLRATEWWAERVNHGGGILGRPVQLVVEEESNPKDTVERYRKLVLQDKVEVVLGGISTGVTLALGPVAEDLGIPWLSWDGTTQKGVEEPMPNPKWAFKSVDNEVEAIVAGILTPKYFKGIKTVAGIGNDYSYGHDCWQSYQAVLKRYIPDVKFVLELFPKLGVTDFTSHIAAIQQSKADLLMCSFWSGDATIIMKQAAAVGLFKTMKGVFTTAGGVHRSEEHTSELQ